MLSTARKPQMQKHARFGLNHQKSNQDQYSLVFDDNHFNRDTP